MNFSCFSEDYVQRLATGDPEVENHFTGYFGGLLRIKLKTKLRSANMIEDVRQETFLRVLTTLRDGRLLYPDRLGGFVNSVCNNVLLETYRDKHKHWPMPDHPPEPADACADLESDLVTRERKEMVERILDELSPKDREILRMIFLEEQDRADICRKLKVNGEYL